MSGTRKENAAPAEELAPDKKKKKDLYSCTRTCMYRPGDKLIAQGCDFCGFRNGKSPYSGKNVPQPSRTYTLVLLSDRSKSDEEVAIELGKPLLTIRGWRAKMTKAGRRGRILPGTPEMAKALLPANCIFYTWSGKGEPEPEVSAEEKQKAKKGRPPVDLPEDALRELYDEGRTDGEIAAALNLSKYLVKTWRVRNRLPGTQRRKTSESRAEDGDKADHAPVPAMPG